MTVLTELSPADARWMKSIQDQPGVYDCCKQPENLLERPDLAGDVNVTGLRVKVCSKCLRKHRRMVATPGRVFSEGKPTQ